MQLLSCSSNPLSAKPLNAIIEIKMLMFLFFVFIKKSHENKHGLPPSYFYKKHHERKIRNVSTSYFCNYNPHEKSSGNIY